MSIKKRKRLLDEVKDIMRLSIIPSIQNDHTVIGSNDILHTE